MSNDSSWMEIAVLIISAMGLIAACCAPYITALANVMMFAGFRLIRDRFTPPAPANAISTDSTLVCHFKPSEDPV